MITGPESSGKTTLAEQLAGYYATQWVPEYARIFLEDLDRPYQQEDLLTIAQGQAQLEDQGSLLAENYLFCDTGLEVIKIWSLVKYREVDPRLEQLLAGRSYAAYLLCRPDLAWEPDPLRETPELQKRWQIYNYYQRELNRSGIPWKEISGQDDDRLERALQIIDKLL